MVNFRSKKTQTRQNAAVAGPHVVAGDVRLALGPNIPILLRAPPVLVGQRRLGQQPHLRRTAMSAASRCRASVMSDVIGNRAPRSVSWHAETRNTCTNVVDE
jgi:hypothetical protein